MKIATRLCPCVCLLFLVWMIKSEGHAIKRVPSGCYRSLRHCKAKCCGNGKFCDSAVIRGCTWYKCVSADCGTLHDPTNGKVDTSMGTSLESLATYTCDEGYELSHTGERVCLSSGQWSGTAPTCEPADCDPLESPCGGSVSAPNTTVGSIATYSCDLGLSLTGDENRTCQSDGYWSGSVPCCEDPCSQLDGYYFKVYSAYYKLGIEHKTFEDAQDDCMADGAYLVIIDNIQEQNYLDSIGTADEEDWWIGLERATHGVWTWLRGNSSLGFANWATGYPFSNDCTATNDGKWRDRPCDATYSYVCELACGDEG